MSEAATDAEIEAAKALFSPYLAANAPSTIQRVARGAEGTRMAIVKPWDEAGIAIFLPADPKPLADALNNLVLPAPFTAIYHTDERKMEVIWTAYPIGGSMLELLDRKFTVDFEGTQHACSFGDSSDRLLKIAGNWTPIGVSDTQHRNLQSYSQHVKWKKEADAGRAEQPPGRPISFWITNLGWDMEHVIRLARHLNYYMTYYDAISPFMFVWPSKMEAASPRTRYVRGSFPENIDATDVEDDLLHFWHALKDGDAGRKFVYAYRIIEHASYGFIERAARLKIKRLIGTAHEFGDKRDLCDSVVATALGAKDMDDGARIAALLAETLDPSLLWKEIILNRAAFEKTVTFDGGYVLKNLISPEDTENTFAVGGIAKFSHATRHIRNHLSHGRDRYSQTSITPTMENFRKLEPWVGPIVAVAGEVMFNKGDI
jgi:hypothetical protein